MESGDIIADLLILEDEPLLAQEIERRFARQAGRRIQQRIAAAGGCGRVPRSSPLVVIADMSLPISNALDLIKALRPRNTLGKSILFTAFGSIPDSVRALRLGASTS